MKYYFSTLEQSTVDPKVVTTTIQLTSDQRKLTLELAHKLRGMIADKFGEAAQACAVTYGSDGAELLWAKNPEDRGTLLAARMQVSAEISADTLRKRLLEVGMCEGLPKR